jgi:hypothetical protein
MNRIAFCISVPMPQPKEAARIAQSPIPSKTR